jgi:hypothetical protein
MLTGEQDLDLYILAERANSWGLQMLQGKETPSWHAISCPPDSGSSTYGNHRFLKFQLRRENVPGKSKDGTSRLSFLVWYPDPDRLGLDAGELMTYLEECAVKYLVRNIRVQAKLDFYSRLHSLEFITQSEKEKDRLVGVINAGRTRFGGTAVAFTATPFK